MVVFWRGWGFWVGLLFVFWIIAAIMLAAFASPYEPDIRKAGLDVQWGFAALLALHGLSVFALAQYRRRHPQIFTDPASLQVTQIPYEDDFMFIRLDLWPNILLAIAAIFAATAYLGYPLFEDHGKPGRTMRFAECGEICRVR